MLEKNTPAGHEVLSISAAEGGCGSIPGQEHNTTQVADVQKKSRCPRKNFRFARFLRESVCAD
jgi:hypothetical protein